eukprot:6203957-Pleurochrysis_carterae.AAC.2
MNISTRTSTLLQECSQSLPYALLVQHSLITAFCDLQPVNALHGQAHSHSILAVMYSILNLKPSMRMCMPAIQLATLTRDKDAKAVGMVEVINGGTTSVGAQLRRLLTGSKMHLRQQDGIGYAGRDVQFHCVLATADFPAMAALLPFKSSTSAHQFDRHSNIDQRSDEYGKPNSFLHHRPGLPHNFARRTEADTLRVVARAAKLDSATSRKNLLDHHGLSMRDFKFDEAGGYSEYFALSRSYIPGVDWIRGVSQDIMHTSLQGTVPLEAGLLQYVFIRIRMYYTRDEINAARLAYKWPAGHMVPEIGKYGNTEYVTDPAWLSWTALVDVTTAALSDCFMVSDDQSKADSITRFDDLQLAHHAAFLKVKEYKGCIKPKHFMSANYPVDVLNTSPLVRTWCMAFEAMLQLLKWIAANSNYKDVVKRMATLWGIRTGLELLDEKLAHWSESFILKRDEDITLQLMSDNSVEFSENGSVLDQAFAADVSPPTDLRPCALTQPVPSLLSYVHPRKPSLAIIACTSYCTADGTAAKLGFMCALLHALTRIACARSHRLALYAYARIGWACLHNYMRTLTSHAHARASHCVVGSYFQPGHTMHAARVTSLIHCGSTYRKSMWAASSNSKLMFVEEL